MRAHVKENGYGHPFRSHRRWTGCNSASGLHFQVTRCPPGGSLRSFQGAGRIRRRPLRRNGVVHGLYAHALGVETGYCSYYDLASLVYFCGCKACSVRTAWEKPNADSPLPYDEFRATLRMERATATLLFSAHSQPDAFRLSVFGSRGRAVADIWENRLTRALMRPVAKPLIPFFN